MQCEIREWKREDKAALAALLNNKKIMDNLRDGLPYPYTQSDAEQHISAMLSCDRTKVFPFAICAEGEVVGSICVTRCENIHFCTAELGYYVGERYWGRGYATGAVQSVCRYVFENTDIIRIFAEPFARNAASCRVLEKAGFVCEGTLRRNAIKNGIFEDMKMYALIKE